MNHNLLTETIEKNKRMENFEQIVDLITIDIEGLGKNTTGKSAIFSQGYFM